MKEIRALKLAVVLCFFVICGVIAFRNSSPAQAQMLDRTQNPNVANFGIAKSLTQEIGAGRVIR
jgi:hypothetical protein